MKSNLEFESSAPAQFAWLASEEFAEWLRSDPTNLEQWAQVVEFLTQGRGGELPPDMLAKANDLIARHHESNCLKKVQAKLKEIESIMLPPPGSMNFEDRFAQLNTVLDEFTDILLETPEPHRSKYLKRVLPAREWLRNYTAD